MRTFLFWSYFIINLIIASKYVVLPLLNLLNFGKTITHKQAAKIIGEHFGDIGDKLINILELEDMSKQENTLIKASIQQKIQSIKPITFKNAINYSENKRYIKWIMTPIIVIILFIISGNEYILFESSARILNHNTFFEPESPFKYEIQNPKLETVQYEDFNLKVEIQGREIPSEVFIEINGNKFSVLSKNDTKFSYLFRSVNKNINFKFIAGGYSSKYYTLRSIPQPKIVDLEILLEYPKYLKKNNDIIKNNGDLIIPEGTTVNWKFSVENTRTVSIIFPDYKHSKNTNKIFNYKKNIICSMPYQIITTNQYHTSDSLNYSIKTISDEYPIIKVNQIYDSINTNFIFEGEAQDDYLIKKITFNYILKNNDSTIILSKNIPIKQLSKEIFFYSINFNKLDLDPGSEIKYYFEVWDNDGFNGSKSTQSKHYFYKEISKEDLIDKIENENQKTKKGLKNSRSISIEIQKEIANLNRSILEKKDINWNQQQKAKEIITKQKKLQKQIKEIQQKNSSNLKNRKKLNSSTLEKQKKLEELINKLIDKEIEELLEKIEEMMSEADKKRMKELLEKLDKYNSDLEKELDRELELFKQLEFEQKIEDIIEKIQQLKNEQEKLKLKTEEKKSEKSNLLKKQQEIVKQMNSLEKDLQDLRQKNSELNEKNKLPETKKNEDNIKEKMNESINELKINRKKKAKKAQEDAVKELMSLKNQFETMRKLSAAEKPQENIETLRKILENLVTLSFNQEKLIITSKSTPKNSSKFIKIVQEQNKISDDSQIIEDSLLALSKRVVQIKATINKEISTIKNNIQKATKELEERQVNKAAERQQFVMTSTNNLALLLSEILEQMQKDLEMSPSDCSKPKNCNKPNPNCNKPSMTLLKEAQKKLNEEIGKCKSGQKGNKKGEGRSKQLMQLAKKQEAIKKQLLDLRDDNAKNGEKGKIDKIIDDMDQNETDIINNRITKETILRQKDIITRLLKAENADREQDEDKKRKSNEWEYSFEKSSDKYIEYKKRKQKQNELLKTTPIKLKPYYKKRVNSYFNTLIKQIQ